jgi:hypothetical protein
MVSHLQRRDPRSTDGGIFEARALRLRSGLGPSSGPSDGNWRIERQSGVETPRRPVRDTDSVPHSTKSKALRRRRLPARRQPQENVSELV